MEYSEYQEKRLAICQTINELHKEYQAAMAAAKQKLSDLADEYLGDFAVGKPVKYHSSKYFVEYIGWIADHRNTVRIRKATRDGSRPNPTGKVWDVDLSELEVWNES